MGYSSVMNGGHSCEEFRPDDTWDCFYIESGYFGTSLSDIVERAEEKWPGINLEEIEIEADYIHTNCLGYDKYDPIDYTKYLKVSANLTYFERKK